MFLQYLKDNVADANRESPGQPTILFDISKTSLDSLFGEFPSPVIDVQVKLCISHGRDVDVIVAIVININEVAPVRMRVGELAQPRRFRAVGKCTIAPISVQNIMPVHPREKNIVFKILWSVSVIYPESLCFNVSSQHFKSQCDVFEILIDII